MSPPIPKKKFKTKLEAHMIPIVDRLVRQGLPIESVAGGVGVSRRTFDNWISEGSEEGCLDELKVELAATVEAARSSVTGEGIEMMKVHAMSDWRACEALLKAQNPTVFDRAKNVKVDAKIETKDAGPQDLSALSLEDLEAYRGIMKRLDEAKVSKK